LTSDEVQKAVLASLDQIIGRGAAQHVRELRARLATDAATQARLFGELLDAVVADRGG
jgi:hypothetical protein